MQLSCDGSVVFALTRKRKVEQQTRPKAGRAESSRRDVVGMQYEVRLRQRVLEKHHPSLELLLPRQRQLQHEQRGLFDNSEGNRPHSP